MRRRLATRRTRATGSALRARVASSSRQSAPSAARLHMARADCSIAATTGASSSGRPPEKRTFFSTCGIENSSWHGTRVAGLIAAGSNNANGIAGTTWQDEWLYKWVEAAACVWRHSRDARLAARMNEAIALIAAALVVVAAGTARGASARLV